MTPPMNVLLITGEDHGTEFGCYGDPIARTPHFDQLAAEGARFTRAQVTQAVCSPGRASILTGLYPHQNGQIGLETHRFRMFREFPTVPALLKAAGYRTGRIGKLHVAPESASPFDMVWNPPEQWSFKHRRVHQAAAVASEFMEADAAPFFLMVNFPDAHLPWLPQDGGVPATPTTANEVRALPAVGIDSPRLREHTANYYNCLSRLDTGLGALLAALDASGKAASTLVIYITDHGPQFSRGKACSYELALRAPLLVRWPGVVDPGTVRGDLASQIDVLPTILDAVGLPEPEGLPGRSLRLPPQPGEREYIFAEWNTSHPYPKPALLNPQRTVRDGRYKLIVNLLVLNRNPVERYYTQQTLVDTGCTQDEINAAPPEIRAAYAAWRQPPSVELYDLEADSYEFRNLASYPVHAATVARLKAALRRWQTETADPLADPARLQRFVDEHDAASALRGGHRGDTNFEWEYVHYLSPAAVT